MTAAGRGVPTASPREGAPDSPRTGGAGFRPDIQGVRGLAVVLVVGFHVREWIPGGFIGVDVFFVVSGFVIATLLRRQVGSDGRMQVRAFFARRVRRLLPMLALTLTVTSVLGVALLSPLGASAVTAKTGVAAALLNANTFLARQSDDYFALAPEANALLHTWSLSVEEQFYLVVPFVVVAGLALRRRSARVGPGLAAGVLGVAALGSFGLFALLSNGALQGVTSMLGISSPQALAFYGAPSRAWEFLVGATLALVAPRMARVPRRARDLMGVGGLLAIVVAAFGLSGTDGSLGPAMLVPVLGTAALVGSGIGGPSAAPVLLSSRPAVALGDVSYGWYLFHWPLIVFAEANLGATWMVPVAALVSLGLAVVAKRHVEDRFRYDDRWRGRRVVRLGLVCVAVPVLAGIACVAADRVLAIDELADAGAQHIDSADCNRRFGEQLPIDAAVCTWSVPDARGRVVLIGDSHASMWSEAVIGAGNELGYDVSIATMSGCPMVGGTLRRQNGGEDGACQAFIERSIAQLSELQPDLVLIGTGSTGVLSTDGGDAWRSADGTWVDDAEAVGSIWEAGLGATVDRLADAGVSSVILHDVPYHDVTTATCGRLLFAVSPTTCASTLSRAEVDAQRARGAAIEDRLDERSDAVGTVDPLAWLCADDGCSTYVGGTWMYRDGDHLSVAGSASLADELRRSLSDQGL